MKKHLWTVQYVGCRSLGSVISSLPPLVWRSKKEAQKFAKKCLTTAKPVRLVME